MWRSDGALTVAATAGRATAITSILAGLSAGARCGAVLGAALRLLLLGCFLLLLVENNADGFVDVVLTIMQREGNVFFLYIITDNFLDLANKLCLV